MGVRHRGRELAFQILFQIDQTGDKVNAVIARFQDMRHANIEAAAFAEELAVGAFGALPETDLLIRAAADHWKLERLLSVDRALLRLGAYELAHRAETPKEVVLDECIALAKTYGSEDSASFVNGVLDRLAGDLRPDTGLAAAKDKPKTKSMAMPKAKLPAIPKPKSTAIPKAKAGKR